MTVCETTAIRPPTISRGPSLGPEGSRRKRKEDQEGLPGHVCTPAILNFDGSRARFPDKHHDLACTAAASSLSHAAPLNMLEARAGVGGG